MGASSSKMDDDDKALQLCRERKKFVKQALDGRCSFAASHVSYVQSLKSTGTALRKFLEPEAPIESSLDTSTNATPEQPLDKTLSQFSLSSSVSRRTDAAETFSPTPSPPSSNKHPKGDSASEVELGNGEKGNSPVVSPLKTASTEVSLLTVIDKSKEKENHREKVVPKDFFSSMKDIEFLFVKASESGKEVPKMLEANKSHFRPLFPAKENRLVAPSFLKACFSCGEDPSKLPEEPAQNSVKYLTWHRTMSSRSYSSANPPGANSKADVDDVTNNLFDNFCMISGSHASTLDRLYAWERKLYDEVKASDLIRKEYDMKCKFLRNLESKGEKTSRIDKMRAVVKDLHSRIRIAILRIDSISKRIEELRDKELTPQLEELIDGLSRMWEVMFECHKLQFQTMSTVYNNSHAGIAATHSELRRQITSYLESELHYLSSSFTKWIGAQKFYLEAINGWLHKCVSLKQKPGKKKRPQRPLLRMYGPPIYATCEIWLEKLGELPVQDVVDSMKSLAGEIAQFLPRQEKNQGKGANHSHLTTWSANNIRSESSDNLLRDGTLEDWDSGFDQFRASFLGFLAQLNNFAGSSIMMYTDLRQAIQIAKKNYHHRSNSQAQDGQWNSLSQDDNSMSQS